MSPPNFQIFVIFAPTTIFLARFLRFRPVQSVVNSPTQISGRGFPHIFYMKLFLSQFYVFVSAPKWKPGHVTFDLLRLMCNKCPNALYISPLTPHSYRLKAGPM